MSKTKKTIFVVVIGLLICYIFFYPKRAWIDVHNDTDEPINIVLKFEGNVVADTMLNPTYIAPFRFLGSGIFGLQEYELIYNDVAYQTSPFLFMNRYKIIRIKDGGISDEFVVFRPMYQ